MREDQVEKAPVGGAAEVEGDEMADKKIAPKQPVKAADKAEEAQTRVSKKRSQKRSNKRRGANR